MLCGMFCQPKERVQSITITAGAPAIVQISRFVTDEETRQMATLFEYFKLEKAGEYRQAHPQIIGPGGDVPDASDAWSERVRQALAK